MKTQNQLLFEVPLVLSRELNEFENKKVGGIPERDYLRWIQFSLNMYFKKTGLCPSIAEDGRDTTDFRNAVEFFNERATGRRKNRKIDEKTQNALIIANEQNSGYLSWLKTQLNKLGYVALTVKYGDNKKPASAILAFQKAYDGAFGFSLKSDGFVGAKTHLALLHAIKRLKRNPKKNTKEEKRKQLAKRLLEISEKIRSSDRDPLRRERLLCMIRKITSSILDGEKLDDILIILRIKGRTHKPLHFIDELLEKHLEKDDKKFLFAINGIYKEMLEYINYLDRKLVPLLIEPGGDPRKTRSSTEECMKARVLLRKAKDKQSLYSCFKPVILKSFYACDV